MCLSVCACVCVCLSVCVSMFVPLQVLSGGHSEGASSTSGSQQHVSSHGFSLQQKLRLQPGHVVVTTAEKIIEGYLEPTRDYKLYTDLKMQVSTASRQGLEFGEKHILIGKSNTTKQN